MLLRFAHLCNVPGMSRRTAPAAQRDDDAFPIRIKLEVPPDGLGRLANEIPAWLQANLAAGSFATHSARTIGGSAMAVYFLRIEDALAFLDRHPQVDLAGTKAVQPPAMQQAPPAQTRPQG